MTACTLPWCVALALDGGPFCAVHAERGEAFRPVEWNGAGERIAARMCDTCDGTGECNSCDGDGEHDCDHCDHTHECDACNGTGECPECNDSEGNRSRRRDKAEVEKDKRERDYLHWALEDPIRPYTVADLIAWTNGADNAWDAEIFSASGSVH